MTFWERGTSEPGPRPWRGVQAALPWRLWAVRWMPTAHPTRPRGAHGCPMASTQPRASAWPRCLAGPPRGAFSLPPAEPGCAPGLGPARRASRSSPRPRGTGEARGLSLPRLWGGGHPAAARDQRVRGRGGSTQALGTPGRAAPAPPARLHLACRLRALPLGAACPPPPLG